MGRVPAHDGQMECVRWYGSREHGRQTGVGPYKQSWLKQWVITSAKWHFEQKGRKVIRANVTGWRQRDKMWFRYGIGDRRKTGKVDGEHHWGCE